MVEEKPSQVERDLIDIIRFCLRDQAECERAVMAYRQQIEREAREATLEEITDRGGEIAVARREGAKQALLAAGKLREDYQVICGDCGGPHNFDTVIPNEIWNQIAGEGDALCLLCIDKRLRAKGLTAEAEFYFVGQALKSKPYSKPDQGEIERHRREAREEGIRTGLVLAGDVIRHNAIGPCQAIEESEEVKAEATSLLGVYRSHMRRSREEEGEYRWWCEPGDPSVGACLGREAGAGEVGCESGRHWKGVAMGERHYAGGGHVKSGRVVAIWDEKGRRYSRKVTCNNGHLAFFLADSLEIDTIMRPELHHKLARFTDGSEPPPFFDGSCPECGAGHGKECPPIDSGDSPEPVFDEASS